MIRSLIAGIFVGDVNWAWRRRVAVSSALVMLAGILHSTFWDFDIVHSTMVMTNCQNGIMAILTIYVAGAVYDDHSKRAVGDRRPDEGAH